MNRLLAHFWEVAAVLLLPAILVLAAWFRLVSRTSTTRRRFATVLLVLESLAFLHIFLGILDSQLLGPDYSRLRYTVIGAWLAISLLTASLSVIKNPIRWLLILIGIYLAFDWLYIGAVSSVV
jgi:hypothetical protein